MKCRALLPWILFGFSLVGAAAGQSAQPATSSKDLGVAFVNGNPPQTATLRYQISGFSSDPGFSLEYNSDFSLGTASCSAGECTLVVSFAPKYPGLRVDAVRMKDGGGNTVATTFLHGIGLGPEAAVRPGVLTDLPGASALSNPQGLAVDMAGNVYVADPLAELVRKVDANGVMTAVAGNGSPGSSGDGGLATNASLKTPTGVAVDGAGNIYIADSGNNEIRRVDRASGVITTVAGNGSPTYGGDRGSATSASLWGPSDIAFDSAGNLYIADRYNGRIRKVALNGIITTVAGGGSGSSGIDGLGNGGLAVNAVLVYPSGICFDNAGNLYIADEGDHLIRKVSNGIISAAVDQLITSPVSVRVDAAGDVYFSDSGSGVVSVVSGDGTAPLTTNGQLNNPAGIAIDANGNIYIADQGNKAVRVIRPVTEPMAFAATSVGAISASQVLTIANIGNQALSISVFGLSGNFLEQSGNELTCLAGVSIAAASSCSAAVAFAPQSAVSLSGSLAFTTNSLNISTAGVLALSGTGTGVARVWPYLSATTLTFTSSQNTQTVTLTNPTSSTITGVAITKSGAVDDFQYTNPDCVATGLPANGSCAVTITFRPQAEGQRSASVTLTETNGSVQFAQSILLTGSAPQPVVRPRTLVFNNQAVGLSSLPQTVTLSNPSAAPLNIRAIALSGPADFSISSTTCGSVVAANSSCTVSLVFTPQSTGVATAVLTFTDSASNSPQTVTLRRRAAKNDYDGTGKSGFAVWRPSNGTWFVIPSGTSNAPVTRQWGAPGDVPVPGDYDGDGKSDFAIWRPSDGTWYIIPSSNPGTLITQQWGMPGDVPVPGDYDGDGKSDFAIWRPSDGTWYIVPSGNPGVLIVWQWGAPGDIPAPGDYDGDGKSDFAIWRASIGTWFVIPSGNPNTFIRQQWGAPGDVPVPGDYDGDGKTDVAIWRLSDGTWYVIPSGQPTRPSHQQWGTWGDVPK